MNETIFYAINSIAGQNPALDQLIIFLSNWFGYVLLVGLLIFLVVHKDKKQVARDLFVVLSAAIAAYAFAVALKYLLPHPRPFEVLPDAHILYTHGGGDSFPSGHATFYMALAVSLFFSRRRLALVYFLGALTIGLARIAVGIHWPLDIFAGWLLGGGIGALAYYLLNYRAYFKLKNSSF